MNLAYIIDRNIIEVNIIAIEQYRAEYLYIDEGY